MCCMLCQKTAGQAAKAHLEQELCPGEIVRHWDSHLPAAVTMQVQNGHPSWGVATSHHSGTAHLRGLAFLTDTNTSLDASCTWSTVW